MADTFTTISAPAEGLFKDRGSKFFGHAYPVTTEEQVKQHLADLQKLYYDARHFCYAYILDPAGEQWRAADDGEPAGTAGMPILNQIRSSELVQLLVVVVRYFGGTKLGVPGLINAYKEATAAALAAATPASGELQQQLELVFPFEQLNNVMRVLKQHDLKPGEQSYTATGTTMLLPVRSQLAAPLAEELRQLHPMDVQLHPETKAVLV